MKKWQQFGLVLFVGVMVVGFGAWLLSRRPNVDASTENTHQLVHYAAVAAQCDTTGTREYWQCVDCQQCFRDEKGLSSIATDEFTTWVTIPKVAHHSSAKYFSARVEATCQQAGHVAYYLCTAGCGQCFADEDCTTLISDVIIPQKAHQGFAVVAKDPTCDSDGCVEHYECRLCHQTFADADCRIPKGDITIVGGHQTDAAHYVPYQAATCCADGHVAHYTCTTCDQVFADVDCKLPLTTVMLPRLEHASDSDYHYQAIAATCESDGRLEYWVCKNGCGQKFLTYQCQELLTADPVVPAFGHDWKIVKDAAHQLTAARRYYDDNDKLVYANARYQETCTHCGKHGAVKQFTGFATWADNNKITVVTGYERNADNTVNDVFTLNASELVERDGQFVAEIKLKLPGTYHALSQAQIQNADGTVSTMDDLSAAVLNGILTLTIRLDVVPTDAVRLVWSFDWDGDGIYEQVSKVNIVNT